MPTGRPALHSKIIRLAGLIEQLMVDLANGDITIPQYKRLGLKRTLRLLETKIGRVLKGLRGDDD